MPAELAIVGFTTGAIGFIVTVKSLISKTIEDVDAVQSDFDYLFDAGSRLTIAARDLRLWQLRWRVYDHCPIDLFVEYWGLKGEREVIAYLGYVNATARAIQEHFRSIIGPRGLVRREPDRELLASPSAIIEQAEEHLRQLRQGWRERVSLASRTRKALFQIPQLEAHLKRLEESILRLQKLSQIRLIEHNGERNEAKWESYVAQASSTVHLVQLAECNSSVLDSMRDLLLDARDCCIELHLDHNTGPAERLNTLESAARNRALDYHFTGKQREDVNSTWAEFSCAVLPHDLEVNRPYGSCNQTFASSLQSFFAGSIAHPSPLFINKGQQRFVVTKRAALCQVALPECERLRSFMALHSMQVPDNLHGKFSAEERHRLAYELAEWTLLFLQTLWFEFLCSCCISRVQFPDATVAFRAIITPVAHIDAETGRHEGKKEWCQEELMGLHIQRLGILLAEIGFGHPVLDAGLNDDQGIEIDDLPVFQGSSVVLRRPDINMKLKRCGMGEDYIHAVDYCLTHKTNTGAVTRENLYDFCENVVSPLYEYYDELTVQPATKPAKKRANRRAALQALHARRLQEDQRLETLNLGFTN